jgi:hypothetical protein
MMIQVSMLPTQGISTRTCAGSPHSKFAGSTGAAECLDGVDKGPSATRRRPGATIWTIRSAWSPAGFDSTGCCKES